MLSRERLALMAEDACVSVRYANAVLAEDGTLIMRLIKERRLERCRSALEDPSQAHRSLSEIAYSWGFSDLAHFGRSFRVAFGSLPSQYRRLAKSVEIAPTKSKMSFEGQEQTSPSSRGCLHHFQQREPRRQFT